MDDGAATNEVIVGAGCATVAAQVVVATVDDASIACSVIEYVPGETVTICEVDVLPFPQRKATGATPPAEDAVHVMLVAAGAPTHEVVNAEAAVAKANDSTNAVPAIEAKIRFDVIF